ncbi:MAG TPA: methyltransferase domain-containing protein, partial [Mycobacteriales bacterium]|nr:methyltransferase domain-containing protein [Mycobacteriales bacterium]
CGHVKVLKNFHDYTTTESVADLGKGLAPRFGTEDTPGREYGMAKMAARVLRRGRLDVLIYGAGRSLDNRHIAKLPNVRRVAIGDIMRVRDEADFVDTGQDAKETFDIVVACEVIEHFVNPRKDFERLFSFVHRAGILVCSTNIYDGSSLDGHSYIFGRGHVSYYSPEALRLIAKANRMYVDFRLPLSSTGSAGPRKRYVIFSHSREVMDAVSDYFGRHQYAPSEKPVPKSSEPRAVPALPRAAGQGGRRPIGLG